MLQVAELCAGEHMPSSLGSGFTLGKQLSWGGFREKKLPSDCLLITARKAAVSVQLPSWWNRSLFISFSSQLPAKLNTFSQETHLLRQIKIFSLALILIKHEDERYDFSLP